MSSSGLLWECALWASIFWEDLPPAAVPRRGSRLSRNPKSIAEYLRPTPIKVVDAATSPGRAPTPEPPLDQGVSILPWALIPIEHPDSHPLRRLLLRIHQSTQTTPEVPSTSSQATQTTTPMKEWPASPIKTPEGRPRTPGKKRVKKRRLLELFGPSPEQ